MYTEKRKKKGETKMKLLRLNDNIINFEAIRNIEMDYNGNIRIHFLNPTDRDDYITVYCRSKKEAKETINIIYEKIKKLEEEKIQRNY